jgi:hypothetical protein
MSEILFALLIFLCLVTASLGCLLNYARLPLRQRQEDTHAVVKLAANVFVVMTSLVLGLMINSAKNTFEAIDHNVHTFATTLILLDKSLREYGPEAAETREQLYSYGRRAVVGTWPSKGKPLIDDPTAEKLLNKAETSLNAIKPVDADRLLVWNEARGRMQSIVELRWLLAEDSEGNIPSPLIIMVVTWLILIFASFGYRAPRNHIVIITLVVASALISTSMYLIMDMDVPFSGPMQVSSSPMHRALAYMRR